MSDRRLRFEIIAEQALSRESRVKTTGASATIHPNTRAPSFDDMDPDISAHMSVLIETRAFRDIEV
jgi:hypothetical protein